MYEYISREEAMTLPVLPREQRIQLRSIDEAFEEGWRQALENLAIIPAADVVEVVRCGECKHYRSWGKIYELKDYTGLCLEWSNMPVHKTGFCSRGIRKRKDGGQDDV